MSDQGALLRVAMLVCALLALAPARAEMVARYEAHFTDAKQWAQVFDDPERDSWQKPDEVIRALALPPEAIVADIGSGTGYFAVRLARALPKGQVIGVDIEPAMVDHLAQRARREGLSNLTSRLAEADDPRLPVAVDLALLVAVYHHIGERERYFRRLRASLKPGGRLAIIDSHPDAPMGPPREHRLSAVQVREELTGAGFELLHASDFLPYQYFLVFRPQRAVHR